MIDRDQARHFPSYAARSTDAWRSEHLGGSGGALVRR
jgi:hypothetical protein